MSENIISVKLEVKNRKAREELEKIVSSMEGLQLQKSGTSLPCDLLILEIVEDLKKEFQLVHSLQTNGTGMEVFLTSSHFESSLLIQALRAGAKEFFFQPIQEEEVRDALLRFKERKEGGKFSGENKKRGKIIHIIGIKGGVGATTVAVNLATSLAELDESQSVALIDMNILFGEIPVFLNIESAFNWGDVARNISRVDSTYVMSVLSKHSSGVRVLPSHTGLDGANVTSPEMIEKLLRLMQGLFDFIVIDGGHSLDDISLKILEMSDTVLLVGVLSLPCLTNLKRLLWTFHRLGSPPEEKVKILISHYHKKSLISLKDAEEIIRKKISWTIPNDYPTTMSAINQGKTLSEVAHGAEISRNFRDFASTFLERGEKEEKGKGLFGVKFLARNKVKIGCNNGSNDG